MKYDYQDTTRKYDFNDLIEIMTVFHVRKLTVFHHCEAESKIRFRYPFFGFINRVCLCGHNVCLLALSSILRGFWADSQLDYTTKTQKQAKCIVLEC